ncbi:MAG: class II glutamine amidotransferase [Bdellovibrionales bacterium]|jgi:predicted glutamine amidotransferase|nr:class II glutamine amidotransferase [Bdellovibrionales bacterium]MBT3525378.1 class II glutamine amidotransferase [Bdellovibrionales bacterium]MBT7670117.1 class II glutamine amidotransferase [Bdellovibrionales bacterium]MBT7765988.1 class II glutamine amidotransferase [Bdellovibrionales bacterium]
MCRLLGFRSIIPGQVHQSLLEADNALHVQSNEHSDGWGVAYYLDGAPHLLRSANSAMEDKIFQRISGVVSSETVVAHIRRATHGKLNVLNSHPFQYGHWIFAHNGNIKNFEQHRPTLLNLVPNKMRGFILGETDSELLFYFILSQISDTIDLKRPDCPIKTVVKAVKQAINKLISITGEMALKDDPQCPQENYYTFLLTNGATMLAHQGGKELYYSTYKKLCPDRDNCYAYSQECENPSCDGTVNYLLFSSEPTCSNNVWQPIKRGQMVGCDWRMKLYID